MAPLAGPVVIAAALLAVAGAQKVLDPRNTVGALRALGIDASPSLVRLGAGVELAIGVGLATSGAIVLAGAAAASYAGFALFVEAARRRGTMVGSCGCFGHAETPPSLVHVLVDVALAGALVAWALVERQAPLDGLTDAPGGGLPFVGLALLATAMIYAALTELPRTLHEVRQAGLLR